MAGKGRPLRENDLTYLQKLVLGRMKEFKMNKGDLADIAGITYTHLCSMLRSGIKPGSDTVIKLSVALKIPLSVMFHEELAEETPKIRKRRDKFLKEKGLL